MTTIVSAPSTGNDTSLRDGARFGKRQTRHRFGGGFAVTREFIDVARLDA